MSTALMTPHSAAHSAARTHWLQAQADTFRACTLCDHRHPDPHTALCLQGPPQPLSTTRASTGRCGPEALHLVMNGWDFR